MLDFANRLLPEIAPGVRPARSVRGVPGSLRVRAATPETATAAWLGALEEALAEDHRAIGYRGVDQFDTATSLAVVAASTVKGLEFDQVVLVEPSEIADPSLGVAGLRRLYTALTRAVLALRVVHTRPLPPALRAPGDLTPSH